ncbi:MAG: SpvB/TcaC N-terminal domain-containing protein [Phycicoccus sp.]
MSAGTDTSSAGSAISLPSGGGAIGGLGEKFSPDLFTGTGNFTVPITVPPGRHGLAPQLSLGYSTGHGNGPFGLGWALSLPGVSRKTSRGVPTYGAGPAPDVFVLSGAEDLVPVPGAGPGRTAYRPRTEGLFARIERVRGEGGHYWEVRSKDGLRTRYGTSRPAGVPADWTDPAAVSGPEGGIFAWRITETADPLGNVIRYTYRRDAGAGRGHTWDQPLISRIEYADYGDRTDPSFLVAIDFEYDERPDPFSDYRAGFEIRTTLRCGTIRISTRAIDGELRVAREYRLRYRRAGFNGASLLDRVDVVGIDATADPAEEVLPPLTFGYAEFDTGRRRFAEVTGRGLPTASLGDPTMALVDLRGSGLLDVVELGEASRYWPNRGAGRFDVPRAMAEAPPQRLGEPGVRFLDADGDGRADLLVTTATQAGYFPSTFGDGWSRRSFQPYQAVPSVDLAEPGVKLIDLDGNGLTDLLSSGSRMGAWFNDADPDRAWQRNRPVTGPVESTRADVNLADVDLADPHVHLADMTGDGLADLVLVRNGNIAYWPNLGHGRFGERVQMRGAPRLPEGHDPRRVLLGDLDGDGVTDLAYVDRGRVLLWGNRTGNGWTSRPVVVSGTPDVVDTDTVQLADLHGSGMAGVLWSRAADGASGSPLRFLDPTGGHKPYLLETMDNHLGAVTSVTYRPSTDYFLADDTRPATRWRTTLPFPVNVVARVEVHDRISTGRLVTEYSYHHGYWDGVEREFRGFARVEQRDTETFDPRSIDSGTFDGGAHFSPPTLTKSWFHPGPVAAVEAGEWAELDLSHEHWPGDPSRLSRSPSTVDLLRRLPRAERRDALRALRGQLVRTELYALDGDARDGRPYTVTESVSGVRAEADGVYFPFGEGQRTTQWERGVEPMTQFAFSDGYDDYGFATRRLAIAVPRGRDPWAAAPAATETYLATLGATEYARRDDPGSYLVDRVCRTSAFEVTNDGRLAVAALRESAFEAVSGGSASGSTGLRVIAHSRTYFDGPAYAGLPLDKVGEHGLPMRTESLAFTDAFLDDLYDAADPDAISPWPAYLVPGDPGGPGGIEWPTEYPAEFRALLPSLAGYTYGAETEVPGSPGGYYVTSARHRYDVHEPGRTPRGLVVASLDPLGAESRIEYDEHDLLPIAATDPVGLVTSARHDLRLLQPVEVTDPNGNTSRAVFSPSGLVSAQFASGQHGEGDDAEPSVRLDYDLLAFVERGQPVSVRSTRRVHHDTQTSIPPSERDEVLVSVEYSDGFGRSVQTRAQAEDVLFGDPHFGGQVIPADQSAPVGETVGRSRGAGAAENVIVSGWQTYDNKGRVVEKYEPFFATGYDFEPPADAQLGQKAVVFYDPRGHAIRTVNPDGSEQVVVFGVPVDLADPDVFAPTAWESFTYDANDNAGRTHPGESAAYAGHWNTPASIELDALGRTVVATARNGPDSAEEFVTRSTYDISGNLMAITDAVGREAFRYRFDLAQRRWRMDSIDAGRRDSVPDALGNPVEARDTKGALTLGAFDRLRRPIRLWARDAANSPLTLRQRMTYGDGGDPDQPAADRETARASNLLGHVVAHHDEAGLVTVTEVDFKGNVLETGRRVIADAPLLATYERAASQNWQVDAFRIDWNLTDGVLLEDGVYRTSTAYDALGRITRQLLPADVEGRRRELVPAYHRGGGLERVILDGEAYVERIAYDAKGQRALVAYGNGVMTRYAYDPRAFRLARLRSERYTLTGLTYAATGPALQDYGYGYDLAGNILTLRDRTPGSGISGAPGGVDALDRHFGYDPVYRLMSATGRECDAPPAGPPWTDLPRCTDVTRARAYAESYTYDPMGNLLRLGHDSGTGGGFVRDFEVDADSNRLTRMTAGGSPFDYGFDANGNLISETTSRHFGWDHADRMATFATQPAGAEPSVHAHYLYDAAGERVKKLVRKQGGAIEVTHYLGGFEHHRWSGPGGTGENNTIHVMDDQSRIALVRVGPAAPGDGGPDVQFHLGDHLGSSAVVTDADGVLTNREEFTPYGETSFGSFARKRYRFTGKERDEESGLNYHSARYYAPALARWVSADPAGPIDGTNPYRYCRSDPVNRTDPGGLDSEQVAGAVIQSDANSPDVMVDGVNLFWDDGRQTVQYFDEERGWLIPSGNDWVEDPKANIFVFGTAPVQQPHRSWLERYAGGVRNGVLGLGRTVVDAAAKVVDMTTMAGAVAATKVGLTDDPWHTCLSSTCQAYENGASQSTLLYDSTVGLVERPVRGVANALTGDPEALGELVGGAGAYGVGSWFQKLFSPSRASKAAAATSAVDETAGSNTAKSTAGEANSGQKPTSPPEPSILTDPPDSPPGGGGPHREPGVVQPRPEPEPNPDPFGPLDPPRRRRR